MSSWKHLETASNIVRRRNPPRIPWATTLHLSFRTDDSKIYQKFVNLKIPGGQVRGAHYVLTREVHKGKHGHQLRIDWRSLTLLRSPDLILTCILHLTKSSCQELTSGTYFTITLLEKDGFRRPQPQTKTPWREAQPCKHSAAKSKVHKWCRSGVW